MCPAGLQGVIHSRQAHQLKQGTHVGCGLPVLFNITDITNSLAEQYFKATKHIIGKLLKVNTDNLASFPRQVQGLRQLQYFHYKKGL